MKTHRYYFEVPKYNIIDYVEAYSLTDAKSRIFDQYSIHWNDLHWIDWEGRKQEANSCTKVFF